MVGRTLNRCTATQWKNFKGPGLLSDGLGLYLRAKGTNGSVIFRYKRPGCSAPTDIGLGSRHNASLAQFREIAEELRVVRAKGGDPQTYWREKKAAHSPKPPQTAPVFRRCFDEYITAHSASWSNLRHSLQWETSLETHCKPILDMPIDQIGVEEVLACLSPIWNDTPETAKRIRGRIENIVDAAIVKGYREEPNPARWKGHLDKLLPAVSKVKTVRHHPALPWSELPYFMADLRATNTSTSKALEFLIMTTARTSEATRAEWSEFDLEAGIWTIPPHRMKARREHRVPLSTHALGLIRYMKKVQLSERWAFPSPVGDGSRPISDTSLYQSLRRMKRWPGITTHGFRSTFRDWAAECNSAPSMIAELCLAHSVGSQVEQAYRRSDLLQKRRQLLEDFGDFCYRDTSIAQLAQKAAERA